MDDNVMIVVAPIFAAAGVEHIIAKLTGLTYNNEVNIILDSALLCGIYCRSSG